MLSLLTLPMKSKKRKRGWHDNDDLWRAWYPFLFGKKKFENAEKLTDRIVELLEPEGKKGLDLACGPGRFAIPLAARGYDITGVDRLQYYLDRGRARARRAGVNIAWRKKDMREFVQPEAFDFVVNLWSSFGYFEDRADDLKMLENALASLRPGGKILIDNMGKEIYALNKTYAWSEERPDGSLFVDCGKVVDDWTRVKRSWLLVRGKKLEHRFDFTLNLYSGQEMRELMERAGFENVRVYGNFRGDAYDERAVRQIAIAQRPKSL